MAATAHTLFSREGPLLRLGCCGVALRTALALLAMSLLGGVGSYLRDVRPLLLTLPAQAELLSLLSSAAGALPDPQLVVHSNGSAAAVEAPFLPYSFLARAGALGSARIAVEAPSASLASVRSRYSSGSVGTAASLVLAGSTLLLLDMGALSAVQNATFHAGGMVPLVYNEHSLQQEPALEAALAALCEAVQPQELEGALRRRRGGGSSARRALPRAREFDLEAMREAARSSGAGDVISHRLLLWWRRVVSSVEARGLLKNVGEGGRLLSLPRAGSRRGRGGAPRTEADVLAEAALGGRGVGGGGVGGEAATASTEDSLARVVQSLVGGDGGGGLGADGSVFTSSYICTRETVRAAVADLPRNGAWALLTGRLAPHLLGLAAGAGSTLLAATLHTQRHLFSVALLLQGIMLLAWMSGQALARARPTLSHMLRLTLFTGLPLTCWFVVVAAWLPEAPLPPASASPFASPRALAAALRVSSPTLRWVIHCLAALYVAANFYDVPEAAPELPGALAAGQEQEQQAGALAAGLERQLLLARVAAAVQREAAQDEAAPGAAPQSPAQRGRPPGGGSDGSSEEEGERAWAPGSGHSPKLRHRAHRHGRGHAHRSRLDAQAELCARGGSAALPHPNARIAELQEQIAATRAAIAEQLAILRL